MDNFEVFFISFDEVDADSNWRHILRHCPTAIRIHGVKGATNAYKEAATKASKDYFYVVEGDNQLFAEFEFKNITDNAVHAWQSVNRAGQFPSYQGCVKAFPTAHFKNYDFCKIDTLININHVPVIFEDAIVSYHMMDVNFKDSIRHTIKQVLRARVYIELGNFHYQLELNKWKESELGLQQDAIMWAIDYAENLDLDSIEDEFFDDHDELDKIIKQFESTRIVPGQDNVDDLDSIL
jgi:hypothetical protein